jgi:1,4-dihydroxy-6-naphthoate synthase
MKITLGYSPCPNDTFIFDALVNKKIDTEGLEFDVALEDVQTLNEWALASRLDVSKISYGVLPLLLNEYTLLQSGGALGKGVGPLLITKPDNASKPVNEMTVAIPGENTTAHMLFTAAYPHAFNKQFMLFSDIEDAVLNGITDAGVIIHENRFTYMQKGLHKVVDLGEYWEKETGIPIPLGGIVCKKALGNEVKEKIDRLIRTSVEYAFRHYPELPEYVKQHAQAMDESVMRQHIDLYVNQYSLALGEDGNTAVKKLIEVYREMKKLVS